MFRPQTAYARDIVPPKPDKRNPAWQILIESLGMSSVSTTRKLGIAARVAGRVISQRAGRNRTFGAVAKAARTTASHFGRALGQLWLEVTGFVFLALAGIGVIAFFREYNKYQAGHATSSRALLAVCFAGLFAWFGVSSFWRVRKKSQSL
jgi:hypothetical protein